MSNPRDKQPPSLLLNAIPLDFDRHVSLRVGRLPYEGRDKLKELRQQLTGSHVVRRHGAKVETVAIRQGVKTPGEVDEQAAGDVTYLIAALLKEWLVKHFTGLGRQVFRRRRSFVIVSEKEDDDLLGRILPRGFSAPPWVGLRAAYKIEVRVERPQGRPDVFLTIDTLTRPCIDATVADLLAEGLSVEGLYVRRSTDGGDDRLADSGRLTGCVTHVTDAILDLTDADEGWNSISAADAKLEPRMEVLAHVVAGLQGRQCDIPRVLEQLRASASTIALGAERLRRVQSLAMYLRRQSVVLAPGFNVEFGKPVTSKRGFPPQEIVSKPNLIFDPGFRHTDHWNQRGLDQHGPYDKFQFTPKHLNIAVICQAELQGRVEHFVDQLLHGVPNTKGGDVGFLRRFALDKPYVRVFQAKDSSPVAYHSAAIEAIEHITDHGKRWDLTLVQIDETMEQLEGDANPYLVSKAFFLSKGIAVQHFYFGTIQQPPQQRAYSLNNIGLACYAKLGGVPWLLPTGHKVAHELVIGIGSHHEKASRFGAAERYVGITTVFSGDGRYLLESRTKAVPFGEYGTAMLDAVRKAVRQIRKDFAWAVDDPVRLVFHVFKPVKDVEVDAVQALMKELDLPHAEFALMHIVDSHPFRIFDEAQAGVWASRDRRKGVCAPPRGLVVKLSSRDALVCLKGAHELKQASDGHPVPLMLRLHRNSSFRDLTYLARQVFAFSCHSWRSLLPAPLPITILYSELVARNLRLLSGVSGWSDDAIVGRIGRTRWFL